MSSKGERNTSRRELLRLGLSGAGLALILSRNAGSALSPRVDEDLLDRALERLHESVTNNQHFLSNHVPMCVEALSALGRSAAIEAWVDEHLEPVPDGAEPRRPIRMERWREALGDGARFLDWRDLFLFELKDADWRDVLRLWTARLAKGLSGTATHGVIRTAHATRSLGKRDCEIRRIELGTALAYWASRYEELPWDGSLAPQSSVEAALARLQPRLPAHAPPRGNIVAGLRSLQDTPSFRPVAGLIDVSDPAHTVSEITAAFSGIYLRNPSRRVHFTHAVTAPSALRLLAPHVDDATLEAATRYAWQAAAGLLVVYHDPASTLPETLPTPGRREIIDRAIANGDAHAIKLTEACLREDAIAPDPTRLLAAHDGSQFM